jgi:hypothetical protein
VWEERSNFKIKNEEVQNTEMKTITKIEKLESQLLRAKKIILKQKKLIQELEEESNNFQLRMWMVLMDVLKDPAHADLQSVFSKT